MSTIQIYEILGIIRDTKPLGKGNRFSIVSSSSQNQYQVICEEFCPARKGDVVSGRCMANADGTLQFLTVPIVDPPSTKEAVQTAFIVALGRGNRISQHLSDRLYAFFQQDTLKKIDKMKQTMEVGVYESSIFRNRDSLNAAVMETICYYANTFRTNPDMILPMLNVGLTRDQASALLTWWYKQQVLRRLYLLGLTRREIREACERGWPGTQLLSSPDALYYQLIENPYLVETLPLEKAQTIAQRYRLSFSQDIIECADLIRFVDKQIQEESSACYPLYGLMRQYPRYAQLDPVLKKVFKCAVRYNFFYLRHQAQVEDTLVELLDPQPLPETHVSEYTQKNLCDEQIRAVEMVLNNCVSVITGSAGSGKSKTIQFIGHELELRNISYRVASFTGKAVSHIKGVIDHPDLAATLHMMLNRALEYDEIGNVLCEYLIIDETSQVPNELIARVGFKLSSAQPPGRRLKLVLVGDPQQIQPIEWGDFFNQVLEAGKVPRVHLQIDHRRTETQGVLFDNMRQFAMVENFREIKFRWGDDCQFVEGALPELFGLLQSTSTEHTEVTVVCPFNHPLDDINKLCLQTFIPADAPSILDSFGKTWKLGSRVMMTKNRYDIKVMNGEEGKIIGIWPAQFCIEVRFQHGREVKIPTFIPATRESFEEEDEPLSTRLLVLSWAVTIDKAQGSQWENVYFFLPPNMSRSSFFNRNRLYTGASRAQIEFTAVAAERHIFEQAIYVDPPRRFDNLSKRLQRYPFVDYFVDD